MRHNSDKWSRVVFRVRGLPNDVKTLKDVASLLSLSLGNVPSDSILVYSLATTLNSWENPRSKVATVMLQTLPSLIQERPGEDEWLIPAKGLPNIHDLILDTHFMGMTPLNDVDSTLHLFDCIAISGLASHPFGSWQPKEGDKTYMWIRDTLPKHLSGTRAVIYGYDTRLDRSQSFQVISDLAQALINQLQSYGWNLQSAKPVAFLVHSLGGLVLKEAIVQLANSPDEAYKGLLSLFRGAVFFGVPNLGMEQSHFRTVVHNNPNEALVDDIARNSNYLRRLNESFSGGSFQSQLKCFWAFETSESPTIQRFADGKIDCNGTPAILVSRESATCRFVERHASITFPINATHSDMVKFTRDSHYYHIVISKLSYIFSSPQSSEDNTDRNLPGIDQPKSDTDGLGEAVTVNSSPGALLLEPYQKLVENNLKPELDEFKRTTGLTEAQDADFKATSFNILQDVIRTLQEEQERNGSMMYIKRLEPFLVSMKEYVEVVKAAKIFVDISDIISYLWGPMKYILCLAQSFSEALNSVLDAYQEIGEQLLPYLSFLQLFTSSPHMREVLVMIYKDILDFHKDIILHFKQRDWKQFFQASWRAFNSKIEHVKQNMRRHRRLIESGASIAEFEEVQNHRESAINTFERQMKEEDIRRRDLVKLWLCPFNCESEQECHRKTRSVCKDPGRWLLNESRFQKWFSPDFCSNPLLWLNGIPGAGKTILASVVVDEARRIQNFTLAFFFCKHGKELRNSFLAVARSILAQILFQNSHLLPYFHEKASMSSDVFLSSTEIAEDILQTALNSCDKTYIIIDGLDDCGQKERIKISSWFQTITEALPPQDKDSIRCLFISQDDGIARKTLGHLPTIKITTENKDDLKDFATVWHKKIEDKFGELRSNKIHIANIISAKAQGMFIFAELLAIYLEGLLSRSALLEELNPTKLPVKLDDVYKRILHRVLESRSDNAIDQLRQVLGWIVCAKRPLRWREIQGAISINIEQQHIDYDKKLLDSPKELFASLVEMDSDGIVQLIHGTAHEYLVRTNFIQPRDVDYSLSMLSLTYLAFPQADKQRNDDDIAADLTSGIHAFYDYASACWAMHLQTGIPNPDTGDKLGQLLETLETFIDLHWSSMPKSLPVHKKVQESLAPMQASESYDRISQAVLWSRKQLSSHCQVPTQDEALDLWQVTDKIRSVLENMYSCTLPEAEVQKLHQFYGTNWFKCPRVSCYYYHQGFSSAIQKKHHVDRHDRPFLCVVYGCPMQNFGCTTEDKLKNHLLEWHGIDVFDNIEFPNPPKPQSSSTAKSPATHQCHLCPKKYTRQHNLKSHLRTHDDIRPFACSVCDERFTRKSDCDRHERGHGEKMFTCLGDLNDGSIWGCKSSFGRADKLADHIRSKTGQNCVRPLVLQMLREGSEVAAGSNILSDQLGTNADALLAAGKLLPSFGQFLRLCGLDKSVINSETA